MSLTDFYSLPKQLSSDIADIKLLVLKPRTLFRKIKKEKTFVTIRRLILYGVLFDALLLAFLLPTFPNIANTTFWQLLSLGVTETILALFPGLVFFLPSRLLSPAPTFKQVISCAVMVKFLLLTPAMFFFAVYLFTESVAVSALRGAIVWVASLSIPIVCPLLLAENLKRRLLVGVLSLFLVFGLRSGVGFAIASRGPEVMDEVAPIFLQFDPIGAELDHMKVLDWMRPYDLSPLMSLESEVLTRISHTFI